MDGFSLTDDGLIPVTIKGSDGSEMTKELDLYELHDRLADLAGKEPGQFLAGVAAYLHARGFPPVSHRLADRLARKVFELVDRLRAEEKNGQAGGAGVSPGSPASTVPASAP